MKNKKDNTQFGNTAAIIKVKVLTTIILVLLCQVISAQSPSFKTNSNNKFHYKNFNTKPANVGSLLKSIPDFNYLEEFDFDALKNHKVDKRMLKNICEYKQNYKKENKRLTKLITTNDTSAREHLDTINKFSNYIDSLAKLYENFKNRLAIHSLKSNKFILFNSRTLTAQLLWNQIYSDTSNKHIFNTSGVSFGENSGSIYTEIINGNLGLMRLGFGTMITASNADTMEKNTEAYQRLISYGGNTVLNAEYISMYYKSRNNFFTFINKVNFKGIADLPAFGTTTKDLAGALTLGTDLYVEGTTTDRKLKLFGHGYINQYFGSKTFKDNLGLNSNFCFGQVTFGLIINNTIKISISPISFSSNSVLRNNAIIAGGQILN